MSPAIEMYKVPPPEMFDDYDTGQYVPPPQAKSIGPDGKAKFTLFTVTAPTAEKFSFRADRNGFLMAVVDGFTIGDYQLRKEYLSSAPFPKKDRAGNVIGTRNASQFGNYLRAHGLAVRPSTPDEYEQYALTTAGREFQASIDWSAYDNDTQTEIASKWEEFPDDPAQPGSKLPYIERDNKRFWARASIKRYVDLVG